MNLFQRATRSCFRKPVKSLLLLLVVCIISLLFSQEWQAGLQTSQQKTVRVRQSAQGFFWNIIRRTGANE